MAEITAQGLFCKLMYDCWQIAPGGQSRPSALHCSARETKSDFTFAFSLPAFLVCSLGYQAVMGMCDR